MMRRRAPERRCIHGRRVPVHTLDEELVAQLCLDCDAQLEPDYRPSITELFHDPNLIQTVWK